MCFWMEIAKLAAVPSPGIIMILCFVECSIHMVVEQLLDRQKGFISEIATNGVAFKIWPKSTPELAKLSYSMEDFSASADAG